MLTFWGIPLYWRDCGVRDRLTWGDDDVEPTWGELMGMGLWFQGLNGQIFLKPLPNGQFQLATQPQIQQIQHPQQSSSPIPIQPHPSPQVNQSPIPISSPHVGSTSSSPHVSRSHFIKVCPVHVLSNHLCYVPVLKFTPFVTQDKIHYRKSSTYKTSYLRGKQFEQIIVYFLNLHIGIIIVKNVAQNSANYFSVVGSWFKD
jgi:hypothetical protein